LAAQRWTIFDRQVRSKIDSPAHAGDFFIDILQTIRVKDLEAQVQKVELIPQHMTFSEFKKYFAETKQHYFPVMDEHQRLIGIFSSTDIRGVLFSKEIEHLVVMKDIGTTDIIVTTPADDLNSVLRKFTLKNIDSLPVVREDDHGILIGMLSRRAVIAFYNEQVDTLRASKPASGSVI
jgi:CIC family chloride channel protein